MSKALLQALAVACELTNTVLSEGAVKVIAEELGQYPEAQVLPAIRKCCKEVRSKLTLADILNRLDDGRPGVEEAWAMLSRVLANERATIVWTEEMRKAYSAVAPLADDPIAARMAFKERYVELVRAARDTCESVAWSVSLGYDQAQRRDAIEEAVKAGRLIWKEGQRLCPSLPPIGKEAAKLLADMTVRAL